MSGTPASSRPVATAIICSSVIWWRLGCMPSRSDMSCSLIRFPLRSMMFLQLGWDGGRCQLAVEDFLRKHFRGAGGSSRHDVKVAGIFRQVVAQPFDFHENGNAIAIKYRSVFQPVA